MTQAVSAKQEPGKRRTHQIGERTGSKRLQAKFRNDWALIGCKAPGHCQLDRDRAEIGKAAQRESDNRIAAR